ncbi:hypothetical protein HYV81_06500 [Candidatus Woesearchaeota archaeon]|nr:hypothetical protein [Candidatus Woesearchaeota archaeon]
MPKRTFDYLRLCIIYTLYEKEKTINSIATETGINWKTVELHLTYLMGRKLVDEVHHSEYARIFALSAQGREFADKFMENITKALAEGKLDADARRRLRI